MIQSYYNYASYENDILSTQINSLGKELNDLAGDIGAVGISCVSDNAYLDLEPPLTVGETEDAKCYLYFCGKDAACKVYNMSEMTQFRVDFDECENDPQEDKSATRVPPVELNGRRLYLAAKIKEAQNGDKYIQVFGFRSGLDAIVWSFSDVAGNKYRQAAAKAFTMR